MAANRTEPVAKGPEGHRQDRWAEWVVCLALVVLVVCAYGRVAGHGFCVLDDDDYVARNLRVQAGLTPDNVRWAFTTFTLANWHPLTWLSLMLDCTLFGPDPRAMHVVNVAFHAVNAVLLLVVLRRMTGALWASAFVAAGFALHPLHVESVAWIAERKDVLSTFFWLLTMAGYLSYVRRGGWRRLVLFVCAPLALGLMAKPMLVTLPFVLLLLDYWPLGRFEPPAATGKRAKGRRAADPAPWRRLVAEKLPLFGLVGASSVITYLAQQHGGAVQSLLNLPLWARAANAVVAYAAYLGKAIVPVRLAVFYPHAGSELPLWQAFGALVLLLGVTAGVVALRRHQPWLVVGWLWFLGTLVPVIGMVQVGAQSIADRYMYVPLVGLGIMAAWGIPELLRRMPHGGGVIVGVLGGLAVAAWTGLTVVQAGYWRDNTTLFSHAVAVTRDNPVAQYNLGIALKRAGQPDEAEVHFLEASRLRKDYTKALTYLGIIEYDRGHYDLAEEYFTQALKAAPGSPGYADALSNLGLVLHAQGRSGEAAGMLSKAAQLEPGNPDTRYNLGVSLAAAGRYAEAVQAYRAALELNPAHAHAATALEAAKQAAKEEAPRVAPEDMPKTARECYQKGNEAAEAKQYARAEVFYREAIRLDAGLLDAEINLGNALAAQGKLAEAGEVFGAVLTAKPNHPDVLMNLGNVMCELGRFEEGARHFRRAVELAPRSVDAACGLGYALARAGQFDRAAEAYGRALALDPGCARAREALAQLDTLRK